MACQYSDIIEEKAFVPSKKGLKYVENGDMVSFTTAEYQKFSQSITLIHYIMVQRIVGWKEVVASLQWSCKS